MSYTLLVTNDEVSLLQELDPEKLRKYQIMYPEEAAEVTDPRVWSVMYRRDFTEHLPNATEEIYRQAQQQLEYVAKEMYWVTEEGRKKLREPQNFRIQEKFEYRLHNALRHGYEQAAMKMLREREYRGVFSGVNPLILAMQSENFDCLELLLRYPQFQKYLPDAQKFWPKNFHPRLKKLLG